MTDDELMTRDRGGKPRVPDIVKDKAESEEFRALEPWNRPNVAVAKITSIVEHHRRVGDLGERAALDAFRDCQTVLDALKSAERIVTTPIPYQYLHMLNILLFFFVYSVPFVFTANFKWVTPFPSAVVALAFYGVNEIGRCMEDPFSWTSRARDLSGAGWRIYRENLQIHEKADEAHAEDHERLDRDRHSTVPDSNPRAIDQPAAKNRRLSKGARVSAADLFRRAVVAAPLAGRRRTRTPSRRRARSKISPSRRVRRRRLRWRMGRRILRKRRTLDFSPVEDARRPRRHGVRPVRGGRRWLSRFARGRGASSVDRRRARRSWGSTRGRFG